jgi:hypothetical protein
MSQDPLLEEYKICQKITSHLDEQNWMWGSFLFGGSIAGAGFVLSQNVNVHRLLGLSILSTVILGGYICYVKRSVGITDVCFSRMREIEATHLTNVYIARKLGNLRRWGSVPSYDGRQPISVFPIRGFHILVGMVALYLSALWASVILAQLFGITKLF